MLTSTAPDPLALLLQPAASVTPVQAVVSGGAPPFAPTLAALLTSVSLPTVGPITGDGTRPRLAGPGKMLPPTGEMLPGAAAPAPSRDTGAMQFLAVETGGPADVPLFTAAEPVPVENTDPAAEPALAWLLPPSPLPVPAASPVPAAPAPASASALAPAEQRAATVAATELLDPPAPGLAAPDRPGVATPRSVAGDILADPANQPPSVPKHAGLSPTPPAVALVGNHPRAVELAGAANREPASAAADLRVPVGPRAEGAPVPATANVPAGPASSAVHAGPMPPVLPSPLPGTATIQPTASSAVALTQVAPLPTSAVAPAVPATAAPLARPDQPVAGKAVAADVAATALSDPKVRATAPDRPDARPVAPQAAVVPPAATSRAAIEPALFALARDIAMPAGADERAPTVQATSQTIQSAGTAAPVAAASGGQQAGIDLTRDPGLHRMIDRIETLRDAANATDTRIRLIPDALGPVEISVRKDGDAVHVRFTAQQEGTRQLIADATPRLTELAEARGVRIDRTSVEAGPHHGGGQHWGESSRQPAWAHQNQPGRPAAAQREEDAVDQSPETRIA